MAEHWSRFWEQGYLTSFAAELPENYTGRIRSYWVDVIESLPAGTCCAVDLGSGNGAIARLLLEAARQRDLNLTIDAVDAAALRGSPTEGITFHGETAMENLPLADGSVDLVVSQYGFEYSDTQRTLGEIARVMRPNGIVRLICHSDTSIVYARSSQQLKEYQALLRKQGFFSCLQAMLKAMGHIRNETDLAKLTRNRAAEKTRIALNMTTGNLMESYPDSIVIADALKQGQIFFRELRFAPLAEKLRHLDRMRTEYRDAGRRVKEQVLASLDEDRINGLLAQAKDLGFVDPCAVPFTDHDNRILGISFSARYRGT
jgi:ubiquinone/menaquinone biosynthesis C-methylase UbiE